MPAVLLPLLPPGQLIYKTNKTKQKLLKEMEVSSPPGTVIGTISQQWSIFNQESVYFGHYPESTTGDILQIADKG